MPIELFAMERMQSTWENLVDYDLSESGVRPLTLRELVEMGFDLEAFLDQPLGYSQSNGTIELRERLAAIYPGSDVEQIEVTNGTSEANYLIALSQLRPGDEVAMEVPNYMQMPGVARSLGATVRPFSLRQETGWEPDWDEFERAVTPGTRLLYLSNPNNPTGSILSRAAMERIVSRCEATGTWLLADEVYLGAEIERDRTPSFWGMSDRVIVTSGLSKAYGIPGVRIGWIVGPKSLASECWAQHDSLTISPEQDVGPGGACRRRTTESRALLRSHAGHPQRTTCPSPASGSPALVAGSRGASRRQAPSRSSATTPTSRASSWPSACASTRAPSSSLARTWDSTAISASGSAAARISSAKASAESRAS